MTETRDGEVRPLVAQAVGEAQKSIERLVAVRDAETTRDGDRNRIRESVAILDCFRDVWEMAEVMPRLAALEAQFSQLREARDGIEDVQQVLRSAPFGMVADDPE